MRIITKLAAAASISALATASLAGGLSDEIMEAPVEVVDVMEPAGTSISPTWIILGVLGALLIASVVNDDDDDDDPVDNGPTVGIQPISPD